MGRRAVLPRHDCQGSEQLSGCEPQQAFLHLLGAHIPHYPLQGTARWREYYKNLPSPRDKYAASVSTLDEEIGKVMGKLKALGLAENTIVVFQSDHGHSEEERTFGGGGYAGPYRGAKFSLFEGGIRVPAIISWPGKLPAGEARAQLATNIDWLPTLAELCGIGLPDKIDGRSLLPVIRSGQAASPHENFFWQSQGTPDNPQWAAREGNWKLLHNPIGAKPAGAEQRWLPAHRSAKGFQRADQ